MCKYGCPRDPEADIVHCYFTCRLTCEVGSWLLTQITLYEPLTTPAQLLRVEFEAGAVTEALVWIAAHTLLYCWERRSAGKQASLLHCKAILTADAHILAGTRHRGNALNVINLLL